MKELSSRRALLSLAGGLLLGAGGVMVEGVPAGGGAPLVIATDANDPRTLATPMAIDVQHDERLDESDAEWSDNGGE